MIPFFNILISFMLTILITIDAVSQVLHIHRYLYSPKINKSPFVF